MANRASRPALVSVETLGAVAVVAFPLQPLIVFAFAFIQPEVPWSEPTSVYALGRLGWLRVLAFVSSGIATLALALGLNRSLAHGRRVRLAVVLLAVSGLADIGTGLFKTDLPEEVERTDEHTFSGLMHISLGLLGFATTLIALFVLRGVFARDPRWQPMARGTRWIAWWFVIGFVVTIVVGEIAARFVFLPVIAWGMILGWRMRRLGPRAA